MVKALAPFKTTRNFASRLSSKAAGFSTDCELVRPLCEVIRLTLASALPSLQS